MWVAQAETVNQSRDIVKGFRPETLQTETNSASMMSVLDNRSHLLNVFGRYAEP